MKIGIFPAMTGRQSAGPETYERCLLRSLLDLDRENEYHVFCLNRAARDAFALERDNLVYHELFPALRWVSTVASLPIAVKRSGVRVLHATVVAPPICPANLVFTMHCFSNFVHPELYPSRKRLPLNHSIRHGLRKSRLALCVSRNVRDHVMERFGIPEERLPVVYHGVGENFHPMPKEEALAHMRERYHVEGPYLLFVGQLKARKNIVRIVHAFARARRELAMPELKLVLAGRRIWTSEGIDEAIAAEGVRDSVIELGHLELADLPIVYSGAVASVFPTLWEGFGMPVIESMACGVPVVTSTVSCLPEVAGGAALLVDPYSVDEIADAMRRLVSDGALRADLRARGLARAATMTWRNTAEQTLRAYRAVAEAG